MKFCSSSLLFVGVVYAALNWSLPTPHNGHTQSDGTSSHAVPGCTPFSGSPAAGSYSYPQTSHTYFSMWLLVW